MRFRSIFPMLMLIVSAGCYSCPSYGPGMSRNPYGSCIGNSSIAPPVPLGAQGMRHRPTLAERKQQRDMKRWYRELEGGSGSRHTNSCPHCQRKNRGRHGAGFDSGYHDGWSGDQWGYDEWNGGEAAYYDGMIMGDGYYDGQVIDGAVYDGAHSGGYCPDCQNSHHNSYPSESYPTQSYPSESYSPTYEHPAPSPAPQSAPPLVPPTEPTPATVAPAPPESSAFRAPADEYYSPSSMPQPPTQQVSIPPVEQILYAPPIQK
ncbi:hypothetical protein Mal48_33370 [Thalassoglobus polymorphus]|uniref:IgA FC receptor n=2 Tax=Thalassoglobus polymorphus TaxID=2527994 RepID=A0A517QR49_9PLAN|nr:hypothetical protein Mal48_33370 [Thalassoglobus polymorphus]